MAKKARTEMYISQGGVDIMQIDFGYMSETQLELARNMADALRGKGYTVRAKVITEVEEDL